MLDLERSSSFEKPARENIVLKTKCRYEISLCLYHKTLKLLTLNTCYNRLSLNAVNFVMYNFAVDLYITKYPKLGCYKLPHLFTVFLAKAFNMAKSSLRMSKQPHLLPQHLVIQSSPTVYAAFIAMNNKGS